MKIRKHLSCDFLITVIRSSLSKQKFPLLRGVTYSYVDCIMSAFAVFNMKLPSLLQFEQYKHKNSIFNGNLPKLYGIKNSPSDTTLRERLDIIDPRQLHSCFKEIFTCLQRSKILNKYRYLENYYIISIDGTGQYSSERIYCNNCCEKRHSNERIEYYHCMLGAVLLHPDLPVVIPFPPEPIVKGDGDTKNDCERNASKRLIKNLRREHPHLKMLIVEDNLAANQPYLSLLDSLNMSYIISAKPGGNPSLFDWIKYLTPQAHEVVTIDGTRHVFHCYDSVPLNDTHHDYKVNVLEYWEIKPNKTTQHFAWITKLSITKDNVYKIMRAGRSRWHIENAAFNTLKNQGYHFEHNYGHGKKNLFSVLTTIMILGFLVDQVVALCCKLYQQCSYYVGRLKSLFEMVRVHIFHRGFDSWHHLYAHINNPRDPP